MAESTTSSHSMEIGLGGSWEIEVDNYVDGWNIDSSGEQITSDEASTLSLGEVMEHLVSFALWHLGVDEVTTVVQFHDFLGEEFDSQTGITENDGLLNFELGEKSVEAVNLLSLLNVCVVLGDTLERELLHEVDLDDLRDSLEELSYRSWESGRNKNPLQIFVEVLQESEDNWLEVFRNELVSFIEDKHLALAQVGDSSAY